jgi:hypothetical protein
MSESTQSLNTLGGYSYHVPPAYSFPKSRKEKKEPHVPGPSDYSPVYRYWSPAYTIEKGRRDSNRSKSILPGPGYYDYSVSSSQFKYSISKASNKSSPDKHPVDAI